MTARALLEAVCETCGGSGQEQVSYTVARCCGHQMANGDCCGNPEPAEDVHIETRSDCGGTGTVVDAARTAKSKDKPA